MEIFIATIFITTIITFMSLKFNGELKRLRANKSSYDDRLKKCEQATAELQLAMATAHRFMSVQRSDSMNAALKAATENPEKYLEGSYFIKPEDEKKDD